MNRFALKLFVLCLLFGCSGVHSETRQINEQTLDEAIRLLCYPPVDCTECDSEKDPAARQEKLIAYLSDRVLHPELKELLKDAGQIRPDRTQSDFLTKVKALGIQECPLWEPGDEIRSASPIELNSSPVLSP